MMMTHGHGGGAMFTFMRGDDKSKPNLTRDLVRRVARYGKPYAALIALALGAIFISSLIALIPPLLYRDLIDHVLPQRDADRLTLLALGLVTIPLFDGLIGVGQRWLISRIGEGIIADLRQALYAHLQKMSLRFFTHTKTGELMSRLNNDVIGAQRAVSTTLVSLITSAFQLVATLFIMISLNVQLTILALIILPLFVLPMRRIGNLMREIVRQQMDLNAEMNGLMNETLNVSGALLVKLFGRQREENAKFSDRAKRVRDVGIKQALIGRWFFMALGLVSALGTALVWWSGSSLVLQGAFTIGTIVAFAAYLTQLYGPIATLVNARVDFATSLVSFERVFEVLDLPIEIQDRVNAVELKTMRGNIQFDKLSFSYLEEQNDAPQLTQASASPMPGNGREMRIIQTMAQSVPGNGQKFSETFAPKATRRWALRDVNFEIQAGQLAALVGPSGAGKTTITYLIPRLYDPTEGRICIDGHDLRDISLDSLSRQIGMVTQETYLLHDTVRANLLFAKPDATQD
ncbi:MAG: ABC transporter ATP-binding protein, partial [Chloroflexi bacterium]|nr:ABC transporter ATP-binding protein [Chloroflexota bacterium]